MDTNQITALASTSLDRQDSIITTEISSIASGLKLKSQPSSKSNQQVDITIEFCALGVCPQSITVTEPIGVRPDDEEWTINIYDHSGNVLLLSVKVKTQNKPKPIKNLLKN